MLTVKAAQSLFKFMRTKPDLEPPVCTGQLGPWVAKLVDTGAGELIVCMNECTFLTVMFPSGYVNLLVPQLYDRTYDLLCHLNVPVKVAKAEIEHYRQITFTRTDDRRTLGVLNEIGLHVQYWLDDQHELTPQHLARIELSISEGIYGAPDYTNPREAVRSLLLN
jgi:hypothetical protein